ncbi:hypothetical protein M408DRAFT_331903 [Serendipita vermifera MAFF 305830]|uniref:Uncharacterized protein n=1 Tax=Serendipita vermifera MAFF 305830 TaxID=933852 RepID=A0A0C3AY51_SERVB|nr:hypothetical protein M408DRAFT_331903 [Serendipita vermifera MAFF 305830]
MAFTTIANGAGLMPPHLGNSGADPIDLTETDNEDELPTPEAKRARANNADINATFIPHHHAKSDHLLAQSHHMFARNSPFPSLSQPLAPNGLWSSTQAIPQPYHARTWGSQPTAGQLQHQLAAISRLHPSSYASGNGQHSATVPSLPHVRNTVTNNNYIDLTKDSSYPLSSLISLNSFPKQTLVLDESLPQTTTILIGQINVSALILSPIPYITQQPMHTVLPNGQVLSASGADYLPVKLRAGTDDPDARDIAIYAPTQTRNGNVVAPDNFAVLETKVAARLHGLLVRRAIKLEGMIRTVQNGSNTLVVPLAVLVLTAKGNVSQIADALLKQGLQLERPGPMWSPYFRNNDTLIYHNPHEGAVDSSTLAGPSRWVQPPMATKNVEIQRSAADAVFENLRGEEDLPETSPGTNISTSLYPHQRKALSFLLEREQELVISATGKATSLWQCNGSGWKNVVTQEVVYTKPSECKGALLADDMGLGKTLETLCLLASTLDKAHEFAAEPLEVPVPPEPLTNEASMEQFVNAVWDMPNLKKLSISKEKKKAAHEKAQAKYSRLSKIKQKTRATLIVCPLSTIVSWEDQIKDHWGGEVTVVGGVGSAPAPTPATSTPLADFVMDSFLLPDSKGADGQQSAQPSRQPSPMPLLTPTPTPAPAPAPAPSNKRGRPIRVYVYHGACRRMDSQFISQFDIVITTYSTLSSEYSKQTRAVTDLDDDEGVSSDSGIVEVDEAGNPVAKKKGKAKRKKPFVSGDSCSPLQAIHWFRVVLDEAHFIKEPTTVASRACCDLIADRRLCLTGTPLQNKVDDVFALIKFIRLNPFDDKATWTQLIGTPIKYNQPIGFTRLQTVMRLLALRRTKETKGSDGKPILSLPSRTDRMVLLKLQEEERTVYDSFFGESQAEFMNMAKADVMKNYVNILQKILRLRQICDDVQLIKASKDGARYDCAAQYEEALSAIEKDGINLERATAIFALLRETLTAQCAECGMELASLPTDGGPDAPVEGDDAAAANIKRGRKMKTSVAATRTSSPCPTLHPIITRCTHLFCLHCFRAKVSADWPRTTPEVRAQCPVCQLEISPTIDAVEVRSDGSDMKKKEGTNVLNGRKIKRVRGAPIENYKPSTKVIALLQELMPFSKKNPYSANYDLMEAEEIQELDEEGKQVQVNVVKSVVFSQWTTMLDKIEDALEMAGIHYERLDGTMKREERNRALDALKNDPKCEVLLVSLKAGGVGLTLTAARRVYLMDPYWNPAVENQAVDRIHRLGQVNQVVATKFIIEDSIEQRLLEVQQKKADLAKMTLGKPLSKQELQQRRMEELQNLLGAGETSGESVD